MLSVLGSCMKGGDTPLVQAAFMRDPREGPRSTLSLSLSLSLCVSLSLSVHGLLPPRDAACPACESRRENALAWPSTASSYPSLSLSLQISIFLFHSLTSLSYLTGAGRRKNIWIEDGKEEQRGSWR